MAGEREELRDWHRLFGLLLTDFFTGTPFTVEVERDLSQQQQLLDIVIVRRSRGRFTGSLPDGLGELADHNLITFKSHHEALDGDAIRELSSHFVAYRKLVSPSPSDQLPHDRFRLYAVCARFPHNLAGLIPWQERQPGVYDCHWGLDTIRVVVAGQLPQATRNVPLHLFSAAPGLVNFASGAYRQRSENTSALLRQLIKRFRLEGFAMSFTMEDFQRQYAKEHFAQLTPEERREAIQLLPPEARREVLETLLPEAQEEELKALPLERRLAGLSEGQLQQYLEQLRAKRPAARKPRRKK